MRRALVGAFLGLAVTLAASRGAAQQPSAEKLAAARRLFTEAFKDEQEKRWADALEKFRSVQQTKNTLAVRYRIASCEEGLGRLRAALADYRALADEATQDADEQGIVKSARDKTAAIQERIPQLSVQLSAKAAADAVVTVDDERVLGPALKGEAMPLDPGDHEVRASATGAPPFASRVSMREQARVSLQIPLDPIERKPDPPPPPPPPPVETTNRTLGYVLLGTAGAFAIASTVTLILRKGEINTLNSACPGGRCPASRETELTAARSRALTEGPLALVFAGVAALAGGTGLYIVLAPASTPDQGPKAMLGPFDVRGTF